MAFEQLEHPIAATTVRFSPGQRVKYVPNHRSFGAFLRSDQMRDVTADVARGIAAVATANQPPPSADTDNAGVTYSVERNSGVVKVAGNVRVKVEVIGTGEGAGRAEFGTRGKTRFRTLGRAGMRFGDMHHSERVARSR